MGSVESAPEGKDAPEARRARRVAARAWLGVERVARTTGRMARGRHGSRAMLGVWLIGAAFFGGAVVYGLTLRAPSWFQSGSGNASELRRVAQRLENRLITEAYRFRGAPGIGPGGIRKTGEDWRVRVTEEEATAWLAVKLGEWLANRDPPSRVPPSVSELQAHFANGRAWVAGRLDDSVYTVSTGLRAEADGLWLSGVRAGVGSLSMPVSWGGMNLVGMKGTGGDEWLWRVATGREPLLAGGTIRLEDGRRVRIVGARILPGAVEVDCRTEVP